LEHGARKDEIERQFSLATMPILIEAARNRQPAIILDTHTHPNWVIFPDTQWVRSYLTVPIQIRQHTVGFLNLDSKTIGFFNLYHAERLQAFVSQAAIAIENARLYEEVQKLAVTDTLTGIYNRTFFETELARIDQSRDFPVSIIIGDLDNLKITNDTLGHPAGDELIKHTVEVLQSVFRAADILARIGGDEFAALLPRTDAATVEQMLSRIHAKLAEHNARHTDLPISLSLGASTAEEDNLEEAFAIADQRMYADKTLRKSKDR
jgi:diguanylate cyclase (GGDEF)-like protein